MYSVVVELHLINSSPIKHDVLCTAIKVASRALRPDFLEFNLVIEGKLYLNSYVNEKSNVKTVSYTNFASTP